MFVTVKKIINSYLRSGTPSQRRYSSILKGGLSSIMAKGVSAIAVIISVPMTLHYLGPERYGLWVTLYSIIAWLSLSDLGLSNGLMSVLTEAYGTGRTDLARASIFAAVKALILLACITGGVCTLLALNADWARIFRIRDAAIALEFGHAVIAAIVLFVLGFPLTVVGKIYVAYQRGEMANIWAGAATMGGLVGLAVAVKAGGDMSALVFGFAGGQFLMNAMSGVWLFGRAMPELRPSPRMGDHQYRRVFSASAAIFVSQLATLLYFQSPNVIISNRLGPEHVTSFQATWNLFFYITLPQMLVGANIWAAIGEANAKKDFVWIKALFVRYIKISLLYGLPFIFVAVAFYEPIMTRWAGPAALADRIIVYWMAGWALLLTLGQPVVSLLLGMGRMNFYAGLNLIASLASVIVAYALAPKIGPVAVIGTFVLSAMLVMIVSYLFVIRPFMEGGYDV